MKIFLIFNLESNDKDLYIFLNPIFNDNKEGLKMRKKFILFLGVLVLVMGVVVATTWYDADFNFDGVVNLKDVSIFSQWYDYQANNASLVCYNGNQWCQGTDLNHDGGLNLVDITILSKYYGCSYNSTNMSGCWE